MLSRAGARRAQRPAASSTTSFAMPGRAFTGSRAALVGVALCRAAGGRVRAQPGTAIEPRASSSASSDNEVAQLNLYTTLIFAPACILGGWLSDRFGRRSTLAIFVFLTVVPTLWLAWTMWQAGWIMPVDMKMANRPEPSTVLIVTFWATCIVYNVFQGLYYGIRSALFMDITTPAVAATQFTAYMALMNLCISYTAAWQGYVVERDRLPGDAASSTRVVGLVGLLLLLPDDAAARRGCVADGGRSDVHRRAGRSASNAGTAMTSIDLTAWRGRSEDAHRRRSPPRRWPALAATLDRDDPAAGAGSAVPPLWHWLYFLPMARQSEIGPDGPSAPRRLPAAGRAAAPHVGGRAGCASCRPLRVGDVATRTLADRRHRRARARARGRSSSSPVRHEISTRGRPRR